MGAPRGEVWSQQRYVTPEDFEVTRVGLGSFERTTLLLSLGRIATRNFGRTPKGRITIEVSFMTGGERLAGEGWVYL